MKEGWGVNIRLIDFLSLCKVFTYNYENAENVAEIAAHRVQISTSTTMVFAWVGIVSPYLLHWRNPGWSENFLLLAVCLAIYGPF